ncbi:hypothetical protein O3G_MSEX002639 [Manduca sexta]|uniref:MADF domain-containing protein n=1 Tax=Manduca sexta TaxID=7130 RepID=A0A921YPI7_MANSE|nr:hypothetical protein O3G_MSEX002639 [Manduca sexta]
MTYCLDVELFISEVKKYPEIWDLNCEDHRYKSRKQQAWAEVARVFINDFDDMPETEKLDVCKYGDRERLCKRQNC